MWGLNINLPLVLLGKWESQTSSLPQTMGTRGPQGDRRMAEGALQDPGVCVSQWKPHGVQP